MPVLGTDTADTVVDGDEKLTTHEFKTITPRQIATYGALNEVRGTAIASTATTDLSAATGPFVHITGTTTITGFGTVAAGGKRVLVFDGALTLTHNATSLILPGGANITTAAGDSAVMVSEGSGNWKCVSYQRANGQALVTAAAKPSSIIIACSDETTALSAGNGKVTFRMPYAFTLTAVRCSLTTAQTSGSIFTVDINEAGTSILSTKLTIDNTATTSVGATTPAVISDTSLADNAQITVDIDQIGDGTAKGLKVALIGNPT